METVHDAHSIAERVHPSQSGTQREFWIGLLFALACHGVLLLELKRSSRMIGAESGSPDAIAVDLVTDADLRSMQAVASPPPGAPAASAATAPPPQPVPQPPDEAPPQPNEQIPDAPALPMELPDLPLGTDMAKPKEKQIPAEKKPAPQARLDLSPPSDAMDNQSGAPGRGSSFQRPPGITRSAQNDEFGRGVIRALQGTMPPPNGVLGRVTVRLILNEKGDLIDVRVVEGSGKSELDRSVVIAIQQTYFPLPAPGSTTEDRTFRIRYVYR